MKIIDTEQAHLDSSIEVDEHLQMSPEKLFPQNITAAPSSLGHKIRNRRKELGLTQKEVADQLGISESSISRYEYHDVKNMGIDKLAPLAKVLQCSIDYLLNLEIVMDDREIDNYILKDQEKEEFQKILAINKVLFDTEHMSEHLQERLIKDLREVFVRHCIEINTQK